VEIQLEEELHVDDVTGGWRGTGSGLCLLRKMYGQGLEFPQSLLKTCAGGIHEFLGLPG
jgi:hypothetical protein